ncbi:MAG: HAMP domain-containing histidine kinase [Bacteroidetes bacterium]|nr:HAMP domain-containing histidine kinase [Bacteroidota bacterium]
MLERWFWESGQKREAEMLGKMDRQVNKLTSLISDLLDVTKISSGKLEFNEEVFDFNKLIEETTEEISRISSQHEIVLELSSTCYINGDKERIGQVITNLVNNAIKYSPNADKIIISSKKEKGKICFNVKDFGIGVPADKLEKIFDQFYRIKNNNYHLSGLGLGLFISSEIITRQGGCIWVEPNIKEPGSTFYFSMPCNN